METTTRSIHLAVGCHGNLVRKPCRRLGNSVPSISIVAAAEHMNTSVSATAVWSSIHDHFDVVIKAYSLVEGTHTKRTAAEYGGGVVASSLDDMEEKLIEMAKDLHKTILL